MTKENEILKRLGSIPFWRGQTRCLPELERIYRRVADRYLTDSTAVNSQKN